MAAGRGIGPVPCEALGVATPRTGDDAVMDEPTFTEFYDRTARRLWNYLRRMSGDPGLADDVLQEAYLRFLRSARPGTSESERVAFLFRTGTNLVYDHWRRRRRESRGLLGLVPQANPVATTPLGPDVSRAFEGLTPRDRALLWLAHVEGWSHREIAASLGLGSASVRVLLFRARAVLGRRLQAAGLEPGGGPR